jgi:hypothetical protein
MKAHPGDTILLDTGDAQRTGAVLDIEMAPAGEHYRVRWDDGSESVIFPQPNVHVVSGERPLTVAREIDVLLQEEGPTTEASAAIVVNGHRYVGVGEARRRPGDPDDAMIGEELAAARALEDLAAQLRAAAQKEISINCG